MYVYMGQKGVNIVGQASDPWNMEVCETKENTRPPKIEKKKLEQYLSIRLKMCRFVLVCVSKKGDVTTINLGKQCFL